MPPPRRSSSLALLPVAVFPAGAAEFIPGWDADGVWNSNVFRTSENEESDFSVRTGPNLRLREAQGDLTYDLNYQARYEAYARIKGLNGIDSTDQYLSAQRRLDRDPDHHDRGERRLCLHDATSTPLFDNAGLVSTVVVGRQRIITNSADASLTQRLGPLWNLTASVGNNLVDYQDPQQSDTTATTGTLQLTRGFTPRLVAGVGAQYQRQEFAAVGPDSESGHDVVPGLRRAELQHQSHLEALGAGGSCVRAARLDHGRRRQPALVPRSRSHDLPEARRRDARVYPVPAERRRLLLARLSIEMPRAGPLRALAPATTVSDVPFVGEQSAGSSLNYFGTISIAKEWRLWRASLGYSRSASNSSGLNASTVLDQFSGTVTWTPSRLWNVEFQCDLLDAGGAQRGAAARGGAPARARRPAGWWCTGGSHLWNPVRGRHGQVDHATPWISPPSTSRWAEAAASRGA